MVSLRALKKSVLTTLFALTFSHVAGVSAQTQPAQMGVTPTTLPEVLQVLDNAKNWVPVGTFAPGGPFLPTTNGAITPGDCIKWGPGLTDANLACGSGSGGGGSGPFTIYTTHAGVVGAPRPTGPYTLYQQGFSAAGKGGSARYEWDATSYCPLGTSSVPVAADSIICVLPAGQTAATAGRFILQLPSAGLDLMALGFTPGGADNISFVPALMKAFGPPTTYAGGYDAFFPPVMGQTITSYYFSDTFHLTRGMRLHCGGGPGPVGVLNSVLLVFGPGVDGVVQDDKNVSADGGAGNGTFEGCGLTTQNRAQAFNSSGNGAGPNSNQILGATLQNGDLSGVSPVSTWHAGDGVIATVTQTAAVPPTAYPAVTQGAYISAVSAGVNLTLASPFVTHPQLGSAFAFFAETGTKNFSNGDQITVGNSTYTFVTAIGSTPGNVLITGDAVGAKQGAGAFLATTQNLYNCINNNITTTTCVAQTTTPNVKMVAPTSPFLAFWAALGGAAGNALPSTYTGTAVGSFTQGAVPHNLFVNGADKSQLTMWQLPGPNAPNPENFTVQTTIGSPSVLVTAGPKLLAPGDIIWSDAFPPWTTVRTVSGTLGAQTVLMDTPFLNADGQNASITHTAGSPGQLWIVPALLKRRTTAFSRQVGFTNGIIGLQMSCGSKEIPIYNCTFSGDYDNQYQGVGWGKYATGSNYSGSLSNNESGAKNFFADLADLGGLGQGYNNFNAHSGESSTAPQGILINCFNQNQSIFFAGYLGAGGAGQCAAAIGLFPATPGGAINLGPMSTAWNGSGAVQNGQNSQSAAMQGAWQVFSGWNRQNCVQLGGSASLWYTFGFSNGSCQTSSTWGLGWNSNYNSWNLGRANTGLSMEFASTSLGYTGYAGSGGDGIVFPAGLLAYNAEDLGNFPNNGRLICMSATMPTGTFHKKGDTCFNTNPAHGSPMGWVDLLDGANFTPMANLP